MGEALYSNELLRRVTNKSVSYQTVSVYDRVHAVQTKKEQ
jgi:hypothetical protein